jgi:mannose-6-phosphate isomerase-like protein (cupin superfamily)
VYVKSLASAPTRELEGLVSHVLLQDGDIADGELAVTWVDVAPGAQQGRHSHPPQQTYLITRGSGVMHVGDEDREVGVGDLVYIPSGVEHGIDNTGEETLTYISAATPAFDVTSMYDRGQISLSP